MNPMTPLISSSEIPTTAKKSILRQSVTGSAPIVRGAGLDKFSSMSLPKKVKVNFGANFEHEAINIDSQLKATNLDAVRSEVKSAINAHLKGDSEGYEYIRATFIPNENDEACNENYNKNTLDMKNYLLALTSSASMLSKFCSGLIKAVLAVEWMGRDEIFVKTYIFFLGSLTSAQGIYIESVLEMLTGYFHGVNSPDSELNKYSQVSRVELLTRVHAALRYILRLIPSASGVLLPICARRFPLNDQKRQPYVNYVSNLLRMTNYATELKLDILALITERLVKIDVQMQADLDDFEDEVTLSILNKSYLKKGEEIENENHSESDTDSVMSDEDLNIDSKRIKETRENVEKMDLVLDMLFSTYSPYFSDANSVEAISMFETLLSHFANIILPAYRSRHTQFLLFHFAQKSEHLIDRFSGTCVQLAFHPGQPEILRQAAAAYLASFVARGAHVQSQIVQTIFDLIGSNLDHIRAQNELTCRGPDLKRYGTFYALTQALLYIFCFRWQDLITSTEILEDGDALAYSGQDLTWIPGIKEILSRIIYSKLNPLKVCSPSIVAEFARIAHYLKFMYVYPLLETNKRIRLVQYSLLSKDFAPRDMGNTNDNNSWYQLDAYFPFDPYHLPVSKRWIDGEYVQWKDIQGPKFDEDDELDSEDESEDDGLDFDDIDEPMSEDNK